MEDKIIMSLQNYKDLLDNETRISILYAEFVKGDLNIEFVAKVMGWKTPAERKGTK